jgi:3-hydroxymyristoyl/3-hydroxydecanoyl-(acyl carrier protein) dehydratase
MEIALQTCGILTSWNKAPVTLAVTHGYNLLFRNLDATAKLYKNVELRGKTIENISKCTGYSMMGPMGVQKFNTVLKVDGVTFYEVDSSFGWFLPEVFEKQIGLDAGVKRDCWHVTNKLPLSTFAMPAEEEKIFAGVGHNNQLRRRSQQTRFLDGVGFSKAGGEHGKGYGHGFKVVDKRDWFFSCHFWCDPVMPGSLGVEAMHQTLELWCVQTGLTAGVTTPTFSHNCGTTKWKYRGQMTPKADRGDVEVHIKTVEKAAGVVSVVADGYLYVDALRVYHVLGLRVDIRPGEAR